MIKIRLTRTGKKHQASYRIVVADSRSKRDGRHIEILGYYNPQVKPPEMGLDKVRYNYWVGVGAQPTEAVKELASRIN
ncbi:MAG: 30S ribosomal protein S16 [Candidatus Cloacimonetes bacterium]|nr:30S ribosomal protein S16 [Candidatus Cloacimonadota bacterium]